jgi:hypothetical protein
MAKYRITGPDGGTYEVTAPDHASEADVLAYAQQNYNPAAESKKEPEGRSTAARMLNLATPASALASLASPDGRSDLKTVAMGAARGVKDVIDTGADLLSRVGGQSENDRVKAMNQAGKQEFQQEYGGDPLASVSRVGGNVAATYPVGPVLGLASKAVGLTRLGNALTSGGMTTGAQAAPNMLARAADMGIRMAGGGATGYVSGGLVDPAAANTGGAVGALLPPVSVVAGKAGDVVASMVRPFTRNGQERIAGDVLRQFSTNPDAAANLRAAGEVVPGSTPTAVMAAGDEGLAGLSRTLQSADPRYAAELSSRMSAQNAARTSALEDVAGNTGKLALAKDARDAATGPMREAVLNTAGQLPARPVLDSIDRLLSKPDNAGKISQSALNEVRSRIAQFAPDGQIDARALYAIRKDINDTLSGKLHGEAGNLRLASGQLVEVKGIIDKAIDQASRRVRCLPDAPSCHTEPTLRRLAPPPCRTLDLGLAGRATWTNTPSAAFPSIRWKSWTM